MLKYHDISLFDLPGPCTICSGCCYHHILLCFFNTCIQSPLLYIADYKYKQPVAASVTKTTTAPGYHGNKGHSSSSHGSDLDLFSDIDLQSLDLLPTGKGAGKQVLGMLEHLQVILRSDEKWKIFTFIFPRVSSSTFGSIAM